MVQSSRFPGGPKTYCTLKGGIGGRVKRGDKGTDVEEWALSKDNGKPFPSQPEKSRGGGDASEPAVRVSTGEGADGPRKRILLGPKPRHERKQSPNSLPISCLCFPSAQTKPAEPARKCMRGSL